MSKKPAKRPVEVVLQKPKAEPLGKSVRYIGMGNVTFKCPSCTRSFSRGMTFEHGDKRYCSRGCIRV